MSGGESDAVKYIPVDTSSNTNPNINSHYDYFIPSTTTSLNWSYTVYKYKYQIKCPAKTCKSNNWLELDIITPCVKCGMKLKAVSEQADFEIEINP